MFQSGSVLLDLSVLCLTTVTRGSNKLSVSWLRAVWLAPAEVDDGANARHAHSNAVARMHTCEPRHPVASCSTDGPLLTGPAMDVHTYECIEVHLHRACDGHPWTAALDLLRYMLATNKEKDSSRGERASSSRAPSRRTLEAR